MRKSALSVSSGLSTAAGLASKAMGNSTVQKVIKNAPALGAAGGAAIGAMSKNDQGQRRGLGGALAGGAAGFGAGLGARNLASRLRPVANGGSKTVAQIAAPLGKTAPGTMPTPRVVTPSEVQNASGQKIAFVAGFQKTATMSGVGTAFKGLGSTIASGVKGAVGAVKSAPTKLVGGVSQAMGKAKAGREAVGRNVKSFTQGLKNTANTSYQKGYNPKNLPAVIPPAAKKKSGSFITNYPVASAIGGYAAYKTIGAASQPQQQQGPQVQPAY